jgi:hypothetical protein
MAAPRHTGKYTSLCLTSYLVPWNDVGPVLVRVLGSPHLYVACFRALDPLAAFMQRAGIAYASVKQIDDGDAFVESLPRKLGDDQLRIVVDPYFTDEGQVRYFELIWD